MRCVAGAALALTAGPLAGCRARNARPAAGTPPLEPAAMIVGGGERAALGPLVVPSLPSSPGPFRVLLVGDGVMFDAAPSLAAAFASTGRANVTDGSRWGMGLTQDGGWGWPSQWKSLVAAVHPHVVVVMLGKWDLDAAEVGGQRLAPGTEAWASWYRTQVDAALAILSGGGAEVVWLGMAPEATPGTRPATAALNTVLRQAIEGWPGAAFVDTLALLGDASGDYTTTAPSAGGALTLRKPDGVHLCPDGASRLGWAAVTSVAAEPRLTPEAGWEAGPWRRDSRYYWAPGGGCPAT